MPGSLPHSGTQRPRKRLIVCCDGTWQASDKTYGTTPSNIAKLSRSFGVGLSENVSSAYHYLSTNFHAKDSFHVNDEIFLFGFSRGAYTARVLSGLVTEMGLLKPEHLDKFPQAFEIYKKLSKATAVKTDKGKLFERFMGDYVGTLRASERNFWRDLGNMTYGQVKIKAVGVWDTVGALGLPESWLSSVIPKFNEQFQFHNTGLNEKIENAFQALALDEHRGAFPPTLWYLPKRLVGRPGCPNLKQCWFPGCHESVGGGGVRVQYDLDKWFPWLWNKYMPDTSQMHEVTLAWMCDQVNGLLKFNHEVMKEMLLCRGKVTWAACPETDMLSLKYLGFFNLNSFGGSRTRKPGQYTDFQTNETMHPSVYYRTHKVKRLHYTGRPLRERFVWAYGGWLPQFRKDVAEWIAVLGNVVRFLGNVLFYLATPIRVFLPSIWSLILQFGEMGEVLVHHAAIVFAHIGRLLSYTPLAFFYLEEPVWSWREHSTTNHKPDGASWVRRQVPCSVLLQDGHEEVCLQEWVIRDLSDDGHQSFERQILPDGFWKTLKTRNRKSIEQADHDPDYRLQFWTRTDWKHRDDWKHPDDWKHQHDLKREKLLCEPPDHGATILHPTRRLHEEILHGFDDIDKFHDRVHRIEDKLHDDLQSLPHKLQDTAERVRDNFEDFQNRSHDGTHDGAHDKFDGLHHGHDDAHNGFDGGHDHSHPGKKNKKNGHHKAKNGDHENLFNGGAVQYT
ncbi:Uncharacterized protein DIS24_g8958 [Lasiodiplodia hormozganensis]|uniref:T6SS Phospholipase effector Tle1-like catalytic domain-containing protein n=1 Tax=Lasiodiplodia hormozganensis TaxID=869390 RepID=A0AA39XYA5_9PEZI|nr:Uncharacterized protein DIS24_g8958 [Lasiodiplodia hormozganensis]